MTMPDLHPLMLAAAARGDLAAVGTPNPDYERCPDCGIPGVQVGRFGPLIELACPYCEPEALTR